MRFKNHVVPHPIRLSPLLKTLELRTEFHDMEGGFAQGFSISQWIHLLEVGMAIEWSDPGQAPGFGKNYFLLVHSTLLPRGYRKEKKWIQYQACDRLACCSKIGPDGQEGTATVHAGHRPIEALRKWMIDNLCAKNHHPYAEKGWI